MTMHDDITAQQIDLSETVPGGSGVRLILSPAEQISAAMRHVGRAAGESSGFSVRHLDECVGFDVRRVFVAVLRVGELVYRCHVCTTYDRALDAALKMAMVLRDRAVNGDDE
jgi:hypothetical protein